MSSNPPHRRIRARPATSPQSQATTQEQALAILQTVGDRTFETLTQTAEYLKQLTPEDCYQAVSSQASKLRDVQEKIDQYMAHILTSAQEDKALRRQRATNMVCEAFETVKEIEIRSFGEKSLFFRKSLGLPPTVPGGDPDSESPPADGCIHGFEVLRAANRCT
jgi:crotonobetainyl-CoA:carnitine CoA-transferase CaiB-like acyl-CoA transferase